MPDIGFLELLLVGVIAFLVLGPERMPELFGQVGRVVRKGRRWIDDVRRQIDAETQLENSISEAKKSLDAADITDWNKLILEREQAENQKGADAESADKLTDGNAKS